jgi:hypothetical protein
LHEIRAGIYINTVFFLVGEAELRKMSELLIDAAET